MSIANLLQQLSTLDDAPINYDGLVPQLDILEKANAQLNELVIKVRMKKIMAEFGERETDVYIVSFAKSGTTLTQMLLYQLTTDGNMDFKHIYDVSPWCRFSAVTKQDMPSIGNRRIIKSHDDYEMLQHIKKGKFIFLVRDFLDVIPSFYHHIRNYDNPQVNIHNLWNRKLQNWFEFNMSWIENKNHLPILYINYEDLIHDRRAATQQIAAFIGTDITETILNRVVERTSIQFMKQHEEKFGEQPEHWKVYNNFIRTGKVGEGKNYFTQEQLSQYYDTAKSYNIINTPLSRYFKSQTD